MSETVQKAIFGFLSVIFVAIVVITCVKLAMHANPIIQTILTPFQTFLVAYGLIT